MLGLVWLTAAGCGSQQPASFTPLTERVYEPRAAPARVSPEPPQSLIDEGYLLIGMVKVRQPVRHCYPRGCRELGQAADATAQAARLAAAKGGDLLVLGADAVIESEPIMYEGHCLEDATTVGPQPYPRAFRCREREIVRGVREVAVTRGTVWRHDPAHAQGSRNRLAWRLYAGQLPAGAGGASSGGGE